MNIDINPLVPLSRQQVMKTKVFTDWARRLEPGWNGRVTINAADIRDEQVHMLQMTVAREGSPRPVHITL